MRDRRRRARRASSRMQPSGTGASRRPRSPCSGRTPIRPRVARARSGDPPAADALRERRPLRSPTPSQGSRSTAARRRGARCRSCSRVFDRYHPTVEEFLAHVEELRSALAGTTAFAVEPCSGSARWTEASSSTARRFPHVLVATGHPGLRLPEELAADRARRPRVRAPRVRRGGRGRRRRNGCGDRVAECSGGRREVISVRRREPERRPLNLPRAALHATRARRVPRSGPGARSSSSDAGPRPLIHQAASGTSRSNARGGGALPRRAPA